MPKACNFIKKEKVLSCAFCEIFKNTFFTDHLRTTALVNPNRVTNTIIIISMKKKKKKKQEIKNERKKRKKKNIEAGIGRFSYDFIKTLGLFFLFEI